MQMLQWIAKNCEWFQIKSDILSSTCLERLQLIIQPIGFLFLLENPRTWSNLLTQGFWTFETLIEFCADISLNVDGFFFKEYKNFICGIKNESLL